MAKLKLDHRLLGAAIGGLFALSACKPATSVKTEITPTTGVFSAEDEAFYNRRYESLVERFKTGQETAIYDTEVTFGNNLVAKPLLRSEPKNLSEDVLNKLTEYAVEKNSASFMVYEDGAVVSENYFGDTTAQTLVNSKSLAKPLGVVAVGRAIEAGFIKSLDQSVADFIVEWQGSDKADISVRHLLDMRTGLLAQGNPTGPEDVLNRAYLHPRHDEVIIHEYPLVNPPGSRYDYSNANSDLVSVVISRATGMPYQEWLTKQVLEPMGMAGGKVWLNREGGVAHSGCCIGLASESYLKLAVLILQNGQWEGKAFLSEAFVTEIKTPTAQNKYTGMGLYVGKDYAEYRGAANPDVKFGKTLHSEPYLDKDIVLFDGNGHQVAYIMPSRKIVVMRLGKSPGKGNIWDNSYLPNLVARDLDQ